LLLICEANKQISLILHNVAGYKLNPTDCRTTLMDDDDQIVFLAERRQIQYLFLNWVKLRVTLNSMTTKSFIVADQAPTAHLATGDRTLKNFLGVVGLFLAILVAILLLESVNTLTIKSGQILYCKQF
jgi:hypothetical protein